MHLVSRLLAIRKQRPPAVQRIDLNAIVTELSLVLVRQTPENIRIVARFDPHLERVLSESGAIEQAAMTLLLNARDAMPNGGTLEIETANAASPEGNSVVLTVKNTGVADDESLRRRLRDVSGLAAANGGRVAASSTEHDGTVFRVYLPRV